jgi:glycosyltransferase involved in cell wall biosynthesis
VRVLCLVPYPTEGASNRLRVEQYAPALRRQGIELVISPFLDSATYRVLYEPGHAALKAWSVLGGLARRALDVARARRYDLVLIHRETAPVGPPLVERALRGLRVPYVYDFDDAIFLHAVHPANRRWRWLRRFNADETTRLARSVIVGNEYLAVWARERNASVAIIPTPVDTERYAPRAVAPPGPVVVGWVGSSTTAPYLRLLDGAFRRIAARHDVLVRAVGGQYAHDTIRVENVPFSVASEPAEVQRFAIGVLPEPDDAWTRGKGAFKALLYMAAGIPTVASRVGVNPEVVVDGQTGFCPVDEDAWVDALERLIADPGLRATMGAAGRRRVEERYSVTVLAPRFEKVLRDAIGTL